MGQSIDSMVQECGRARLARVETTEGLVCSPGLALGLCCALEAQLLLACIIQAVWSEPFGEQHRLW